MKVIFDLVKYNKSIYFSYSVFLRQHELAKTYTLVDSFIHGNFLLVALVSLLTQAFFFFLRNSPVHYTRLYIQVVGCIQYLFHRALVFPCISRDVAGYQFVCYFPWVSSFFAHFQVKDMRRNKITSSRSVKLGVCFSNPKFFYECW